MFRAVALDKLTFPLQGISVNPEVARRLPFHLACRYQALPVAEDDGHLTVAMAHPEDLEARRAILAALPPTSPRRSDLSASPATTHSIDTAMEQQRYSAPEQQRYSASAGSEPEVDARGMSMYLVQGDPAVIDSLLADVWPGRARRAVRLLVAGTVPNQAGLHDYAQALGRLLGAEVSHITCDEVASTGQLGSLKKLLLVIQNDDELANSAALACAVRLARLSGATVTILTVVPSGPENSLSALLTAPNTAVGQAARQLVQAGIAATLRLRQGSLERQLHREVIETDYDLVLIGSKPILPLGYQNSQRAFTR